ncbi:MAG TPA: nucleotide exchange factor GrpE [Nitrospira sp.]|nr:nucleotide exchange factor GrpE [Nitrospira sp.]
MTISNLVGELPVAEDEENSNIIERLHRDDAGDGSSSSEPRSQDGDLSEVAALQQQLAAKSEEIKTLNDKYLRLAAEFENFKRLTQREQREQIKFGNEQLLKALLPTVDNLERALKAAKDSRSSEALIQGVELTLKQLLGTLEKFGVEPVPSVGHPFDPAAHQAVANVPSKTVPPQHVVDEFQRGYLLHDRILRAAMVTVSTGQANDVSA